MYYRYKKNENFKSNYANVKVAWLILWPNSHHLNHFLVKVKIRQTLALTLNIILLHDTKLQIVESSKPLNMMGAVILLIL